jgi:hypothetical protein
MLDLRKLLNGGPAIQPRTSPVSYSAMLVTIALGIIGPAASAATGFTLASLPNIILIICYIVILDTLTLFVPQTRIVGAVQTVLFGVLYLATTCVFGVLAAYSVQRFGFPLRDEFLANADKALGFEWIDFARWVDSHSAVQAVLHAAYDTIFPQIILAVVVLAFSSRPEDVRAFLLAMAIAFICTILVSALMPAAGPIVFVDRATFSSLHFTGATPIDHLLRLREAGPLIMTDHPGGIATFPSFHTTVAVLVPLTLLRFPRVFVPVLILDAAMLAGTITEGAHYLTDVLAGAWMAFFGFAMARRVLALEAAAIARYGRMRLNLRDGRSGLQAGSAAVAGAKLAQ